MAISDQLTQLNTIKGDIKAAIIAKGGTATDDFTTYATAISNLPSGGGDEVLRDLIERDISGSFTIPSGTTKIGPSAFYGCSGLTSITIPNSVTSIGYNAFYECSGLTSLTIPDSVTYIGAYAFISCNKLTSLTIPDSVTVIDNGLFQNCSSLTSITIPALVTKIGEYAFYNCSSLTSITIPASVTSIGRFAFQQCSGLTSITCLAATPPTIQYNTFQNVPSTCPIYVPAESVEAYQAAQYWSNRAAYIQAIPSE